MANANARDTAFHMIRKKIIDMDLKPGETLSDKDLAEQMGISRTPVREAMIMLSIANLVVVRPQSGTFVAPIDLEIVEMEQFMRCAMEKEMIRLAMDRMNAENWSLYEENLHLYDYYSHSQIADKEKKLLELDNNFHRIAFEIGGKEKHYARMLASMQHIERLRVLSLHLVKDDRVIKEHSQLAETIRDRNIDKAGKIVEKHMQLYVEHLMELRQAVPQYFVTHWS